eukprot:3222988-Prorocentrum_lima.AAC.1
MCQSAIWYDQGPSSSFRSASAVFGRGREGPTVREEANPKRRGALVPVRILKCDNNALAEHVFSPPLLGSP